jgi:hypothetical protein
MSARSLIGCLQQGNAHALQWRATFTAKLCYKRLRKVSAQTCLGARVSAALTHSQRDACF